MKRSRRFLGCLTHYAFSTKVESTYLYLVDPEVRDLAWVTSDIRISISIEGTFRLLRDLKQISIYSQPRVSHTDLFSDSIL